MQTKLYQPEIKDINLKLENKDKLIRELKKKHLEKTLAWDTKLRRKDEDIGRIQKMLRKKCDDFSQLGEQYEQQQLKAQAQLQMRAPDYGLLTDKDFHCGPEFAEKWLEELNAST